MNSSRILGGLLCIVSAIIAILHIGIGYFNLEGILFNAGNAPTIPLAFALPVTVVVLIATGLGFWLGWIMATTKEAEPAPSPPTEEEETEEVVEGSVEETAGETVDETVEEVSEEQ